MAALALCRNIVASKCLSVRRTTLREITTSGKKRESTGMSPSEETLYKKVIDFSKPSENKNWASFGFDKKNKDDDLYLMHLNVFCLFGIVLGGFFFAYVYYPDRNRRDWFQREAFIRLYEREQLGLDPIDPNYVDPSKIILPPDSELSEDEIII